MHTEVDMTLIRNADIYAPEHIGIKDILIGGGKILAIEDRIDLDMRGLKTIDAEGAIVHPGFIDGHVHAIGGGGESGMLSRVPALTEKKIAQAGVTTIVGLLGTDGTTRTVRDLVAKIQGFREWGLSAYCLTGSYQVPTRTLTGSIGDDIVYVNEIIGVKVAIADHRCSFPSTDELIRMASEARIASLMSKKCGIVHFHVGADKLGISQLFEIIERTPLPIKHLYPTHMGNHMDQAEQWLRIGGHVDITCHDEAADQAIKLLGIDSEHLTLSTDSNGSFPKWNEKREIIGMGAGSILELPKTIDRIIAKGVDRSLAYKLVTENPAKAMSFAGKGRIEVGYDADIDIEKDGKLCWCISKGNYLVADGVAKPSMYDECV